MWGFVCMSSCHNKPIRGQCCSANQRAQSLFTLKVSSVSVAGLGIARCAPILFIYRKGLKFYLFIQQLHSIWKAVRNLTPELHYKQEEQFSLTVKCNNWLPIFVLWPRHYFVFLVIVLTFYQIIRGKIKPSLDRGNFQVFNKIISRARRILFLSHHLICFHFSLKITHVMLLRVPGGE